MSWSPDDLSTHGADCVFFMHVFCCPRHWGVCYELLTVPQKQKADQASPKPFSAREMELAGAGHSQIPNHLLITFMDFCIKIANA